MRFAWVAVVVFCSFSARAQMVPPLKIDVDVVAGAATLVAQHFQPYQPGSQVMSLPPDYTWVERDSRAFWYAAGGAAVTSLITHVLVGVPVLVLGASLVAGVVTANPVAGLILALGIAGAYSFGESLLSSLTALLIFNQMSELYNGDYATGLLAHFTGNLASTAVTTMTFGGGALLFHGVGQLAEFTGSAGIQTISIFSFLGAMPAVVVAGIALVAVPALVCAWALAASASPKEGFAIDEDWLSPSARIEPLKEQPHYAAAWSF